MSSTPVSVQTAGRQLLLALDIGLTAAEAKVVDAGAITPAETKLVGRQQVAVHGRRRRRYMLGVLRSIVSQLRRTTSCRDCKQLFLKRRNPRCARCLEARSRKRIIKPCPNCHKLFEAPIYGSGGSGHGRRCPPCRVLQKQRTQAKQLRSVRGRWTSAQLSARARHYPWHLTIEQFETLIDQPCSYCNRLLIFQSGAGLDRLDETLGYTLANVVPCCPDCNVLRNLGHFTPDEMRRLGPCLGPIWDVHPCRRPLRGSRRKAPPAEAW